MKKVKGTRDFLPELANKFKYLEDVFLEVASSFGFENIRVPTFEKTSLFARGVGDTTDIVKKEMFQVISSANMDKYCRGEYSVSKDGITLRPEGTAGVVRMLVENKEYVNLPKKYSYIINAFRNERPQAGRYREFTQLGAELFGSSEPISDVYIIMLLDEYFKKLGLKNYKIKINSIGCKTCRPKYYEELKKYVEPKLDKMCSDCNERFKNNPLRILDCKVDNDIKLISGHPVSVDYLCESCASKFNFVKDNLEKLNIKFEVDASIVRGLDYYCETAFEVHFENIGAKSAIGGGGRYNDLVELIGGPDVPAIGFALGADRIVMALESEGFFDYKEEEKDVYFYSFDEKFAYKILPAFNELRESGFKVEMELNSRSLKSALKYANKNNFKYVVLIGEDEYQNNSVIVKNMKESDQKEVKLENIVEVMKNE